MVKKSEIMESLHDAGCDVNDIEGILCCYDEGNKKKADRLIAECRRKQLEKLHESQRCIDRLDYLSYMLGKEGVAL